ncbi:hypothetical protein CONPUDRAFT_75776 [Coniophora puteana RWD-64-598 SS2]|uniref:Uncharacterized protein n=1 Tax=Coniophora puteana (strain RWD-64-598) TaxID=741705 RepID=A0A5M3MHD9_CONPW|nr:uncharacterized protein CONPUDRAFT_75776 [Coniophora puteana RWD-64-598 SS2]EIW78041.1 hypothetical protein CONPUDRAFT_75776 [Coniophora puteana RWD-64-598 SS2]
MTADGEGIAFLNLNLCVTANTWNFLTYSEVTRIPPLVFVTSLLSLAIWGYCKHAANRKKVTGHWSVGLWMKLLVTQNFAYFLIVLCCYIVMASAVFTGQTTMLLFGAVLASLVPFIIVPRLLLSFRSYRPGGVIFSGDSNSSYNPLSITTWSSLDKDLPLECT